jgi:outer membrane protein assembly factor BamB
MHRKLLVLVVTASLLTGCSTLDTVKGWFGGGKSDKKANEPAELVNLANPIAVRQLWSTGIGDGEDMLWLRQHPALEGSRLFVADDQGQLLALDAASGQQVWAAKAVDITKYGSRWTFWKPRTVEGGLTSSPGAANGLVVVGGRNGEVVAFNADSGQQRWVAKVTSEVLSTPLVLGDRVVVRSNDGRVFGFDPADGARKWVFDRGLPSLTVRGNGSPVSANGLVYIGYDDGSVVALRVADGQRVWEQIVAEPEGRSELDRMADVDGELQIGTDEVFAVSYHNQMQAIAAVNGQPLWNRDVGSYAGLALLGDRLIVADKDGNVWALDRATGNSLWKQDALQRRQLTTPVVQGEYAVVGDLEGYLHWIKLETGDIVGRERLQGSAIRGTPQVSAEGVLYALTSEGDLAAYQLGN